MKPYVLTVLLTLTVMITLKARESSLSEGTGRGKFLAGRNNGSKFGIKAGYNAARITGQTSNYKPGAEGRFSTAAFFAPRSRSGFGYRSEVLFSRQGFGFDAAGKKTLIANDYFYLPQLTTFGRTRFLQLQACGQFGYLIRSSKKQAKASGVTDISSFPNRFDDGETFGAEVSPAKGLTLGGRYAYNHIDTYKTPSAQGPSPIPKSADVPSCGSKR